MSDVVRQVIIRGRVQGVGYRYWTRRTATARDLQGWVRNRGDGSVEALFAGPEEIVADMIAICRHGPASAQVDAVDEKAAEPDALNLRRRNERFSELSTI